jgi:hypothetical protein
MAQWPDDPAIGARATAQPPGLRQAGPDCWTGYDAARAGDYRHGRGYAHGRIGSRAQAIADYERAHLLEPEDDWRLAKLRYLARQD